MAAARDRRCSIVALALLAGFMVWFAVDGRGGAADMTVTTDRERADALVTAYARHVGAGRRTLDAGGDVSFGSSGLHYDAARAVLTGRVFVNGASLRTAKPEGQANYRRMVGALNDPAIGGMFERGGGVFVLDEAREAYSLVVDFPVATTDRATLIARMETLQDIAAAWTTRWFFRVAKIMHGHEPAPTVPVTRATDPG